MVTLANLGSDRLDSLPVCLGRENSNRLVSLWEVLQIKSSDFMSINETVSRYCEKASKGDPKMFPNNQQRSQTLKEFGEIRECCLRMGLTVSPLLLRQNISDLESKPFTLGDVLKVYEIWHACFQAEMDGQLMFLVKPERVGFYESDWTGLTKAGEKIKAMTEVIAEEFPSAVWDMHEAGNCFAFERFTACVYHLMRAAEFGLVAACKSLGAKDDRLVSWDRMIQFIESEIKKAVSTQQQDFKEIERKYGEIVSWFVALKNGWRNPVSHIPRTYSENKADKMFSQVAGVFAALKEYGIPGTPMPTAIVLPE